MTTKILNKGISLPTTKIKTSGIFSLTRRLTPDESAFLTFGSKSKLQRALHARKSQSFEEALKDSGHPENVLNILSFVDYVGQTFIKLESKGHSTPEKVASAVKGLEELFSLPVFDNDSEPVKIAFGSATFRISDKEFYKVSCAESQIEVRSGMLTPIWNPPVVVNNDGKENMISV